MGAKKHTLDHGVTIDLGLRHTKLHLFVSSQIQAPRIIYNKLSLHSFFGDRRSFL